jgi:DNA-binding SARP family transcriptional activator
VLELYLFGSGRARYGERCLSGFPNRLPCLLLCYLVLHRGRAHGREQLAALFWGDHPTSVARKRLRHALWWLRTQLAAIGAPADGYLAILDDTISFDGEQSWIDVQALEAAAAGVQGVAGQALDAGQAARLEAALDLYQGPLLDGVYDDWCLYERERLHLLYLDALGKLIDYHESSGSPRRGLEYGERVLASDETRENVHRQMMRLYWRLGDRGAAIAQYRRCAQLLRETMGLSPMAETDRLYRQIATGQEAPPIGHTRFRVAEAEGASARLMRQALDEVRRLETAVDETRSELRQLSDLIQAALSNAESA